MSQSVNVDIISRGKVVARASPVILFKEGNWLLMDATDNRFNVGNRGWNSVIKHYCDNITGSPYWMLIEWHTSPTLCVYCQKDMPPGIVALFKLQNMEMIR